ncbi:hypothetical protein M2410_000485 [Stenotrophomonas chelatiphaga]|nr:hypothetical protein [Stenotrophomonas chelatiphaga]
MTTVLSAVTVALRCAALRCAALQLSATKAML